MEKAILFGIGNYYNTYKDQLALCDTEILGYCFSDDIRSTILSGKKINDLPVFSNVELLTGDYLRDENTYIYICSGPWASASIFIHLKKIKIDVKKIKFINESLAYDVPFVSYIDNIGNMISEINGVNILRVPYSGENLFNDVSLLSLPNPFSYENKVELRTSLLKFKDKNYLDTLSCIADQRSSFLKLTEDAVSFSYPVEFSDKKNEKKYYTDSGIDCLIFSLLTNKLKIEKPLYVDIGAWHPYLNSYTAIFNENGCHGINIEPNPILIEAFHRCRPDDINICCGVSDCCKSFDYYYVAPTSPRNGFILKNIESYVSEHDLSKISKKSISVRTLDSILSEVGFNPDFLNISVEGLELNIINSIEQLKQEYPKIILIEIKDTDESIESVYSKLEKNGYQLLIRAFSKHLFILKEFYKLI